MSDGVEVKGYEELHAVLQWGARRMPDVTARGIKRGAVLIEKRFRENLSGGVLQRRTSTLVRSVGQDESDRGLTRRIGASTFYLAIHEGEELRNATREGEFVIIQAKQRYMRFKPAGSDHFVSVPRVRIPVRRPLGVTYEEVGEDAMREAVETLEAALDAGGE